MMAGGTDRRGGWGAGRTEPRGVTRARGGRRSPPGAGRDGGGGGGGGRGPDPPGGGGGGGGGPGIEQRRAGRGERRQQHIAAGRARGAGGGPGLRGRGHAPAAARLLAAHSHPVCRLDGGLGNPLTRDGWRTAAAPPVPRPADGS